METKRQQPSANAPQPIPAAFWENYIDHFGLARYMGWSEEQFWAAYTAGRTPSGCNLMPLFRMPAIVFRLSDLEQWEQAGFPAQPGSLELAAEVSAALVSAFESEGVIFPDKASEYN